MFTFIPRQIVQLNWIIVDKENCCCKSYISSVQSVIRIDMNYSLEWYSLQCMQNAIHPTWVLIETRMFAM